MFWPGPKSFPRKRADPNPSAVQHVLDKGLSRSSLAGVVRLAGGEVLPEHKLAVRDRPLNPSSIDRFAAAVAAEAARAKRP